MTALIALLLAAAQPPEPPMLHRCIERIADFEGTRGTLTLEKHFQEDGSPFGFAVTFEDGSGAIAAGRAPGTRTSLTLRWPRARGVPARAVAGWPEASIHVYLFDDARAGIRRPGELWRRVLVDRGDDSIVVPPLPEGGQGVALPGLDLYLASELQPFYMTTRLDMSLDSLLAWGSGRERLTVYETVVTPLRPRGRDWERAIRSERVVGVYDIDVAALARLPARVRAAAEAWEAGLTDLAGRCERVPAPEPSEWDIVATDAPRD